MEIFHKKNRGLALSHSEELAIVTALAVMGFSFVRVFSSEADCTKERKIPWLCKRRCAEFGPDTRPWSPGKEWKFTGTRIREQHRTPSGQDNKLKKNKKGARHKLVLSVCQSGGWSSAPERNRKNNIRGRAPKLRASKVNLSLG